MPTAKTALSGLLLVACWSHLLPAAPDDEGAAAALREAASKGREARVEALLKLGVAVDTADKSGHTALMMAAQYGRADMVSLLLSKGAKPGARDKSGYTAWGLATFLPVGHGSHQAALQALPQPARPRVVVNSGWTPVRLVSSCFMAAGELTNGIGKVALDKTILDQFQDFATVSGKKLIDIQQATERGMNGVLTADGVAPPEAAGGETVVNIQVQPGAACSAGRDSLSLEVDVRVFRVRDRALLMGRTFAGGIKGLRSLPVDNATQYLPVYLKWIKEEIEPIYWGVTEALYRSEL